MALDKETLRLYIHEQSRFHDELTSSSNGAKTKIATYIGTILALFAFLYAGALDPTKTVLQRLFIPDELYGKIFYAIGLFFLLFALGKLIHGARPNGFWSVGYQSSDLIDVESMSETDYLIKLKNNNDEARASNIDQYNKKFVALKDAFFPMLIGAIIMIVLRYFQ